MPYYLKPGQLQLLNISDILLLPFSEIHNIRLITTENLGHFNYKDPLAEDPVTSDCSLRRANKEFVTNHQSCYSYSFVTKSSSYRTDTSL
jgi:hypothetical protein